MTREIPLTRGYVAIVDDADYERVAAFKWHACSRHGRVRFVASNACVGGRWVKTIMHRLVCQPPTGMVVDHIDGNPLNNTRSNLRVCSQAENSRNRRKHARTRSAFKGIHWVEREQRWRAVVKLMGRQFYFGVYENEEDAARAYDVGAIKIHGQFARLNFPGVAQ